MNTLFWKLLGAFWLTTVAILAISIFVSFRLAGGPPDSFADPREIDVLLRELLQTDGVDAVRGYIGNPNNFPTGQTVYLVDESGRDLLDRPVPLRNLARARRVWNAHADHESNHRGPTRRLRQHLLEFPDGRLLLAMPGPVAPARFGVLSLSNVRWTVFGLAAAISLLSFWWLSRSLTRRVADISDTAARLAGGDLAARVGDNAYTGDEIGRLAEQFDRMAQELDTQSKTRHELFRNIAHELRAPLTRLQIATELLDRQPEQAADHLDRIRYEIDRVENLTRQVLALARAEQVIDHEETVSLTAVVRQVVSDAEFEARAHDVRLVYNEPADDIRIRGNETTLASAIENVVRNAVQFAPSGGQVTLAMEKAPMCTLTVCDNGPGVAENELQKIFEPFYRIDTNRPGAGIGLAISKRVLQQLGGELSATNQPGGGLKVTMRFPRHVSA